MTEFEEFYAEQQRKERQKIERRNLFCDLLGKFKMIDGREMEILAWQNGTVISPGCIHNASAKVFIRPSEDEDQIKFFTYKEVLEMTGRDWPEEVKEKQSA